MIKLFLGLGAGEVIGMEFDNTRDLIEYIKKTKEYDVVWLATDDGEFSEIIITEHIDKVILAIETDFFNINTTKNSKLFLFENSCYKDAYLLATDMRETNPKCYD